MASMDPSRIEKTHEGQRNSVWNRSSRKYCRRRGRRLQHRPKPPADHGPTRTGTKDSEYMSETGLRGGNVEDEVDGCSTVQYAELTLLPTNRGTLNRETLSATGRKQVVQKARRELCHIVQQCISRKSERNAEYSPLFSPCAICNLCSKQVDSDMLCTASRPKAKSFDFVIWVHYIVVHIRTNCETTAAQI